MTYVLPKIKIFESNFMKLDLVFIFIVSQSSRPIKITGAPNLDFCWQCTYSIEFQKLVVHPVHLVCWTPLQNNNINSYPGSQYRVHNDVFTRPVLLWTLSNLISWKIYRFTGYDLEYLLFRSDFLRILSCRPFVPNSKISCNIWFHE